MEIMTLKKIRILQFMHYMNQSKCIVQKTYFTTINIRFNLYLNMNVIAFMFNCYRLLSMSLTIRAVVYIYNINTNNNINNSNNNNNYNNVFDQLYNNSLIYLTFRL